MKNRKMVSVVGVVVTLTLSQAAQAMVAESSFQAATKASNNKDAIRYNLYQEALAAAKTGNFEKVRQHFPGDFASFELDNQKSNFYWAMVFIAAVNGDRKDIVAYLKGLPRFAQVQEVVPYFEEDGERDNAVRLGSL